MGMAQVYENGHFMYDFERT